MKGVAAFLQAKNNGKIRLVFNDVEASSETNNLNWRHNVLFTHNDYDAETIKNMSLSKEQFAEIGENLVIRLLSLGGYLK